MKKSELKALAEKHGMEIIRNPITREGSGVCLETAELVPELESIVLHDPFDSSLLPVSGERFGPGPYVYRIYAPKAWFDLWGWAE